MIFTKRSRAARDLTGLSESLRVSLTSLEPSSVLGILSDLLDTNCTTVVFAVASSPDHAPFSGEQSSDLAVQVLPSGAD